MKRILNLVIFILLFGCKKDEPLPLPTDPVVSPTTGSRFELTTDSLFLYAKQVYLWHEALPSYADFAPRSRYLRQESDITLFKQELFDISQFKINPQTKQPFEYPVHSGTPRYSYLTAKEDVPNQARASGESIGDAVLHRTILTHNSTKFGYIALDAFPLLKNAKSEYDKAFEFLSGESFDELIVDLRTNNGGYVETAEYIANLLAPATLNGKKMFSQVFNEQMQQGKATILSFQPYLDQDGKPVNYQGREATMHDVDYSIEKNTKYFSPAGKLNQLRKISFITSAQTASAAELLISIMKPYLNVRTIGQVTYGKPVGFFAINIDQYSLFLSSFHLLNADGWNGYFEGISPTVTTQVQIHPSTWGNPADDPIKNILEGGTQQKSSRNDQADYVVPQQKPTTIKAPIPMETSGLTLKNIE